jgi:hypothetical protein
MASNEEHRFFSKAEEYIAKVKSNDICPKKYYTRHTDPRHVTENQLHFDKRSIIKKRRQLKKELKFINYNLSKVSFTIAKHERTRIQNTG